LIILGTSYRVLEIFKTEYKMHFTEQVVANLGYDELIKRLSGGTSPIF
jgi:hypothetical protein